MCAAIFDRRDTRPAPPLWNALNNLRRLPGPGQHPLPDVRVSAGAESPRPDVQMSGGKVVSSLGLGPDNANALSDD